MNAGKGIRAPARLRVAVFETAALPLGYPGSESLIFSIIKQIRTSRIQIFQHQKEFLNKIFFSFI